MVKTTARPYCTTNSPPHSRAASTGCSHIYLKAISGKAYELNYILFPIYVYVHEGTCSEPTPHGSSDLFCKTAFHSLGLKSTESIPFSRPTSVKLMSRETRKKLAAAATLLHISRNKYGLTAAEYCSAQRTISPRSRGIAYVNY